MKKILILTTPRYAAIVAAGAAIPFMFMVLYPYLLAGDVFFSSHFSVAEKISFLGNIAISEANGFYSAVFATKALSSLLFGVTLALIVRYFALYRATLVSAASAGTLALFASLLGVGCISCGALFGGTLASFAGLSALLLALPFQGLELSIAGILLLLATIFYVLRLLPSESLERQ